MEMEDDYAASARRWYGDGSYLLSDRRHPGAAHAFGLAAECALKRAIERAPGRVQESVPHRHLPELVQDAKRWLRGREYAGLSQLVNKSTYMQGWTVQNRYWPDAAFSEPDCQRYRDHALRTLRAAWLEFAP